MHEPSYAYFRPIHFRYKKVDLRIGANAVVAIDSVGGTFRLFPDVDVEHFLVPKKVRAFAGLRRRR